MIVIRVECLELLICSWLLIQGWVFGVLILLIVDCFSVFYGCLFIVACFELSVNGFELSVDCFEG